MKPLQHGSTQLRLGKFKDAQDTGASYLLSLDPERLLAPYLQEAGLESPAPSYGNWENTGLDGHTLGHVLSAAAHLHSATGDVRANQLVEKLVSGVSAAQRSIGTGYVGGIPHGQELWARISAGDVEPDSFGLNGAWVPWYNLHKLFAGLIDAHVHTASATALEVVTALADWWLTIARTLSDDAYEAMLRTEFGAMNAAYADLFELTGQQDYLWLAKRFSDHSLFGPAARGEHILPGMHANTQIQKAYGYARVGAVAQEDAYTRAAAHLWKQTVELHTYAFGGNSVREHYTPSLHFGFDSEQGPETCNTYNMLRLTRELLGAPQDILAEVGITLDALLDYYERALFNHILSSQHPDTGGLVYFTPVRPNQYRVYSSAQECFWCCVGTGLENHARYPELIYGRDGDTLCVNLGIASTVHDPELGITIEQPETLTDSSDLVVRVIEAPQAEVEFAIRLPWWSRRNNQTSWRTEKRVWHEGDELRIPLAKRTTAHIIEPDPTHPLTWVAFFRGPFALVARTAHRDMPGLFADDSRMGHVASGEMHPLEPTPIVVSEEPFALGLVNQVKVVFPQDVDTAREDPPLHDAIDAATPTDSNPTVALVVSVPGQTEGTVEGAESTEGVEDASGTAGAEGTAGTTDAEAAEHKSSVVLEPLYLVHESRYTSYFPLVREVSDPTAQAQDLAAARQNLADLDTKTLKDMLRVLDFVQAGEQQPESDHGFVGSNSMVGGEGWARWREAAHNGHFSYDLRTRGETPALLKLTLAHQDQASTVVVRIGGNEIARIEAPERPFESAPFFDVEVELPQLPPTDTITCEFVAPTQAPTPRVFQVRLLK